MSQSDTFEEAIDFIRSKSFAEGVDAGVILGSGLGGFGSQIKQPVNIPYQEVPGFPVSTVQGHAGELILGVIGDKKVVAFSGRFHRYEGFSFEEACTPVAITNALEADKLIISNAAGSVNRSFNVGDLVIVESVLRQIYPISIRGNKKHHYGHEKTAHRAEQLAIEHGSHVRKGNYLFSVGPNYETKAEIRAFRKMGADLVGMSTAPELFEAARLELKAVAISLVTNMAAGIENKKLEHSDVKETAKSRRDEFSRLVKVLINEL